MKEKPFVTVLFLVSVSLLFLAPWVGEAAQPLSLWEPTSLLKYVYMLQCQPLKAKRVGYRTSLDMRTTPHVLAFFLKLLHSGFQSVVGNSPSNDAEP